MDIPPDGVLYADGDPWLLLNEGSVFKAVAGPLCIPRLQNQYNSDVEGSVGGAFAKEKEIEEVVSPGPNFELRNVEYIS